jgi:hypothetical protein
MRLSMEALRVVVGCNGGLLGRQTDFMMFYTRMSVAVKRKVYGLSSWFGDLWNFLSKKTTVCLKGINRMTGRSQNYSKIKFRLLLSL